MGIYASLQWLYTGFIYLLLFTKVAISIRAHMMFWMKWWERHCSAGDALKISGPLYMLSSCSWFKEWLFFFQGGKTSTGSGQGGASTNNASSQKLDNVGGGGVDTNQQHDNASNNLATNNATGRHNHHEAPPPYSTRSSAAAAAAAPHHHHNHHHNHHHHHSNQRHSSRGPRRNRMSMGQKVTGELDHIYIFLDHWEKYHQLFRCFIMQRLS